MFILCASCLCQAIILQIVFCVSTWMKLLLRWIHATVHVHQHLPYRSPVIGTFTIWYGTPRTPTSATQVFSYRYIYFFITEIPWNGISQRKNESWLSSYSTTQVAKVSFLANLNHHVAINNFRWFRPSCGCEYL